MYIAFLDELGHIGPYVGRSDPRFYHSPVFGLAGYVMPHEHVRHFATTFFQKKCKLFAKDIKRSGIHPATWEKKGTDIFTTKTIRKYPSIREVGSYLINHIDRCGGKVFYYAREKHLLPSQSNATGLYTTVMSHAIHRLDDFCVQRNEKLMMILDHHDDRVKLLEAATKTMFGQNPARSLVEPPFHVESHLYQTIQAADWIATIVGRLLAFRLSADFSDWKWAEDYYRQRVDRASSHSRVWQPRPQAASTQAAPGAVVITTATVTSVAAIGTGAN